MRWLVFQLALGAALLGQVCPAAAQDESEAEARREFRAGLESARAEDWQGAREHFERAYALVPRPSILANLASAQRQTGQLLAARSSYRLWLENPEAELTDRVRDELDEVEGMIPRITIEVDEGFGAGDLVTLDGDVVEPGEAIDVDPGRCSIAVRRRGEVIVEVRVDADPSEHEVVSLVVPAAGITPREVAIAETTRSEDPGAVQPAPSRTWLWVTLGVIAVVGAAVGVALALRGGGADPFQGSVPPGSVTVR